VTLNRKQFLSLSAAAAAAVALPMRAFAAAPAMVTKTIPKTGEKLPCIGLGTIRFTERGDDAQMARFQQVIQTLFDNGGTLVDTATSYGDAESIIGELFEKMDGRAKSFLATKIRIEGRDQGIASIENSFKALRTDKLDLVQIHNLIDTHVHLETLRDLKAKGRIRYIGLTHFRAEEQEALGEFMEKEDLDFVQLNYSVDVREPEKRLLSIAQDKGIAVLVNLPLGRTEPLKRVAGQQVPEWAKQELNCTSFAQLLLKFVVSHPAITAAIPGTTNPVHMVDNAHAGIGPLADAKQRERIAAIWNT